jgi:antitoxin component YwqK of YwqJK toxin-antitoxin module
MQKTRSVIPLLVLAVVGVAFAGDITCPLGTKPSGEDTQDVKEKWCETTWHGKTVEHGPYRAWWPNGRLGSSGQYVYGKAEGKWVRWYPSGKLQSEEWFEAGKRVKSQYFDEFGHKIKSPET